VRAWGDTRGRSRRARPPPGGGRAAAGALRLVRARGSGVRGRGRAAAAPGPEPGGRGGRRPSASLARREGGRWRDDDDATAGLEARIVSGLCAPARAHGAHEPAERAREARRARDDPRRSGPRPPRPVGVVGRIRVTADRASAALRRATAAATQPRVRPPEGAAVRGGGPGGVRADGPSAERAPAGRRPGAAAAPGHAQTIYACFAKGYWRLSSSHSLLSRTCSRRASVRRSRSSKRRYPSRGRR
jgi:hypothetical protein